MQTLILGAGPAGLSAAYHIKNKHILIEKEDRVGGLARSIEKDGFIFDFAGHIFFTKDRYANALVKKLLSKNIHFQRRDAYIYSKNTYTRYPFQANTHGLPKEVILECVLGVIEASRNGKGGKTPKHFKEWIVNTFGRGIAKHFMIPYNKKVWATPLEIMTYEWIENRVMTPKIEEVLEGALESKRVDFGPNSRFAYPLYGGCQALADSFLSNLKQTELLLNSKVINVDTEKRIITLKNYKKIEYDAMISTLPLPEIIKLCTKVPTEVKKAAQELLFTSVYCLNIGIDHPKITDKNWIYYPEEDVTFQRLFIQSNASSNVAPQGKSSITAEISYSKFKPVSKNGLVEKVINDLIKTGFIHNKNQVILTDLLDLKYGYIIFKKDRLKKVNRIKNFLQSKGILVAGRFGEWEYYNMDHAILSGKEAAENISREIVLTG
tara:strand:+ start:13009 stop:14316 length:1308 start_codon:yes stop_codon:yes gene_type:complete